MCLDMMAQELGNINIKSFKVAQGHWPQSIDECAAWVITGSPKSCYDSDPWIQQLIEFTQSSYKSKKKLLGLCFGHQLIAKALGGNVEKSNKGWGVGIREFNILKNNDWMSPPLKSCSLLFSHQDQVIALPPDSTLLARDEFCPHQMFCISDHIFCIQGHPEFTNAYARQRLDSRRQIIGERAYQQAIESLTKNSDAHIVWQWINQFLDF